MWPPNANDPLRTADHQPKPTPASPDVTSDIAPASLTLDGTASDVPGEGTEVLAAEPERPSASVAVPGYAIEGVLGRGGMGVVYKARHLALKRTVALKMVLAGGHAGPRELARFRIEAEAVARLQHPNIVQVFEVGEADGHPYCALEFVEGGNLASKLDGKPLPAREAAKLVEALSRAMQLAHSRNVVHRDLKPANVLLASDGTPKITDFGLARQTDSDSGETQAGAVMGTPSYMAPEQASGNAHDAGPVADVYALGAILYACLAGRPPFAGKTIVETLDQVRNQEPVSPSRWRKGVPLDLETICLKCLRKEPENRYASSAELADDLVRYQQGEPIRARPVGRVERAGKWVRRNPVVTAAVVALVMALVGGTTVSYLKYLDAEAARLAEGERVEERDEALGKAGENLAAARKAEKEATEQRNLLQVERDLARRNLYFAEMTLAGIAAEAPAGLGRVVELLTRWNPAAPEADLRGWEWYYLDSLARHASLTLHGHVGPVNAVAYTRDGKRLATGGDDHTVRIWDTATGREITSLRGHSGPVRGVAWSPDGVRLATASLDGTARIWHVASGRILYQLCGPGAPVQAVAWRPDGARVATYGYDAHVRVWDAETGREAFAVKIGGAWGMAMKWSPDGKRLAAGSWANEPSVIDGETGAVLTHLRGHKHGIMGLDWSPRGDRVASASFDGTARVWDPTTGKETALLQGAVTYFRGVCWSPDGEQIAAGGANRAVQIWDADTGQARAVLRGNLGDVLALAWSQDGTSIAASSEEGAIRVWDVRPASDLLRARAQEGTAETGFDWARDGRMATRDGEARVRVWDPASAKPTLTLDGGKRPPNIAKYVVNRVQFSPDGTRIAVGGDDDFVRIWNAASGEPVRTLGTPTFPFNTRWSPDGTRIACSGWGWALGVWDVQTGRVIVRPNQTQGGQNFALAWSPSGDRIATAGPGAIIRVWDSASGRLLVQFGLLIKSGSENNDVWDVSWSPDGRQIASAGWDGKARVWDAASGREVLSLSGHSGRVMSIGWSPDGKRIASGSTDRTVKLWDPASGRETLTLRGHADSVNGIIWHPDGCRLATRDGRGNVLIWDATPGFLGERSAATLPGLAERVRRDRAAVAARRLRAEVLARQGDWNAAAAEFAQLSRTRGSGAGVFPAGWWALAGPDDRPPVFPPTAREAPVRWLASAADPNGFVSLPADGKAISRVFAPRQMRLALDVDPVPAGPLWLNEKTIGPTGFGPILVELHEGWNCLALRGGTSKQFVRWRSVDTPAERLELAQIFYQSRKVASATRLWAEALESDPKLGDDRQAQHRYNAACAAAMAAVGQGLGDPPLDDAAKAKLRQQALDWLNAELTAWSKLLESGPPQDRLAILRTLKHWQQDTRLAVIRDAPAVARLPANERAAFTRFWADVTAARDKARPWIEERLAKEPENSSLAAELADLLLSSERQRFAAMRITDPWVRLAAAYRILDDQKAIDKLLESHPAADLGLGDLYAADQDWKRAIAEYTRVITVRQADANLSAKLATAYQSSGRTREAVPHLARVSVADPKDTILALKVAGLQAWFGQDKELAATRQRNLALARGARDQFTANRAVFCCVLHPPTDKAELETALALARTDAKVGGGAWWVLLALGMAEYRSGNYVAADEALLATEKAIPDRSFVMGTSAFYRAMSLFRQGKADEARKLAVATAAKMKRLPADEDNPLSGDVPHEDLILWLAYKESRTLIK